MRGDAKRVEAILEFLRIADRETLDFLLDSDWDLGCGCCSYTPSRVTGNPMRLMSADEHAAYWAAEVERSRLWREANPGAAAAFDGLVDHFMKSVSWSGFGLAETASVVTGEGRTLVVKEVGIMATLGEEE